jgi:hypothetical protein
MQQPTKTRTKNVVKLIFTIIHSPPSFFAEIAEIFINKSEISQIYL